MKSVSDLLQDADPLRHEPRLTHEKRERLRHDVVSAASDGHAPASRWFPSLALVTTVTLFIIALTALGSRYWSPGNALQAAVRFEVRLAEDGPARDLREAQVSGSDRVVYLHEEIIVSNEDIAQSRVYRSEGASGFAVAVEFTAAGAQKMRAATANHVGKPVAVLVDGEVVSAPVLRAPISTLAVISGDYTRAEAEKIVEGIGIW